MDRIPAQLQADDTLRHYRSVTGSEHLRGKPPRRLWWARVKQQLWLWGSIAAISVILSLAIVGAVAVVDRMLDQSTSRAALPGSDTL